MRKSRGEKFSSFLSPTDSTLRRRVLGLYGLGFQEPESALFLRTFSVARTHIHTHKEEEEEEEEEEED